MINAHRDGKELTKLRDRLEVFSEGFPIYVTRKTGDGLTTEYSLTLWQSLLAMWLVWINVVLWSVAGIIVAVGVIF